MTYSKRIRNLLTRSPELACKPREVARRIGCSISTAEHGCREWRLTAGETPMIHRGYADPWRQLAAMIIMSAIHDVRAGKPGDCNNDDAMYDPAIFLSSTWCRFLIESIGLDYDAVISSIFSLERRER